MRSANKYVLTIAADYDGHSEMEKLKDDLRTIGQIESFENLSKSLQKTKTDLIAAHSNVKQLSKAMADSSDPRAAASYERAAEALAKLHDRYVAQSSALTEYGRKLSSAREHHLKMSVALRDDPTAKNTIAYQKATVAVDKLALSYSKKKISVDQLKKSLGPAAARAREFKDAFANSSDKDIARQYSNAKLELRKLSVSLAKQTGQVRKSKAAFTEQGLAVGSLTKKHKELKAVSANQGSILAAQMKLGVRSILSVNSEIKGLERAYEHLKNSGTQSVKELAVAKDRLRTKVALLRKETNGWTSHLSKIQQGWVGLLATAGAVAAAANGITFFSGFDDSMREVQAFTQAGTSEMEDFTTLAENLGTTTRYTATEVAQGMAELTQSGIKSYQELSGIIPDVTNLSSASGMQFKESADMITDTMKQFVLGLADSGRVADVISKGYTTAGHSAQQLGAALSYVGPVAKAMDYSLEETVAIINALAEAGYKGQRGGTALRGGFTRLIKPAKEAEAILQKYKIQIYDSTGAIRNFANIMDDVGNAAMNQTEMMTLFGQEAGPGMQALVNVGADSIREFQKVIEDAGGTAQKIAGGKESGIGGVLRELNSSAQGVVITFVSSLAPAIQEISKGLTVLTGTIAAMPQSVVWTISAVGSAVAIFAAWNLGLKHIHNAMMLASGDVLKLAGSIATFAMANPVLAILTGALLAGVAAWKLFGGTALDNSKKHAEAAKAIGQARIAIDDEISQLEKLQQLLSDTTVGTKEHTEAEIELAKILPDANLKLDEQGRLMAEVADATGENSTKLAEYLDLKKEESRMQVALQLEQQAKAYFEAGDAVKSYSDDLVEWYGIGEKSTNVVQDFWRGVNRLTGTYDKNIQKGSEMRSNLTDQEEGFKSLLHKLLRTDTTIDQVNDMLNGIHLDDATKDEVIAQYQSMVDKVNGVVADGVGKGVDAHKKIADAAAESARSQVDSQVGALNKMGEAYGEYADKVKKLMPGDEGYEGSKAYQSWKAIEGAGNTLDAPEESMTKDELAAFYKSKEKPEEKKEEEKQISADVAGLQIASDKRLEEKASARDKLDVSKKQQLDDEISRRQELSHLKEKVALEQEARASGFSPEEKKESAISSGGPSSPMWALNKQLEEVAAEQANPQPLQDPVITTPDPVIVDASPALNQIFDEYVDRTKTALEKAPWSVSGNADEGKNRPAELPAATPEIKSLADPLENMKQQARDAVAAVPASLAAMTSSSVHSLINKLQTGGSRSASSGSRAGVAVNVPKKIVELRFPGGSLQGGEPDVNALLSHLEKAGLTA